jgi:hypothetical protein
MLKSTEHAPVHTSESEERGSTAAATSDALSFKKLTIKTKSTVKAGSTTRTYTWCSVCNCAASGGA